MCEAANAPSDPAKSELGGVLPEPGDDDNVDEDALTERYYELAGETKGFLSRVLSPERAPARHFDHLIVHRDDDGFYLPVEFDKPLDFTSQVSGPGWIGSTPRLAEELESLRRRLDQPDAKNADGSTRFEREQRCLEALSEACRASLESGSALAFT